MADVEIDPRAGEDVVRVEGYHEPDQHDETYKGLACHTYAGLHERVGELMRTALEPGARVLDVAAGSGALSLRLSDLCFDMTACDYVGEAFQLEGVVPFQRVNLNHEFAAELDGAYDGVTAVEIIEHLENPRHFVRQCSKLLRPGGRLLITTPNIESVRSLETFLRKGTFTLFNDASYEQSGHITPVGQWQLCKILSENGFTDVRLSGFSAPRRRRLSVNGMRRALVGLLSRHRRGRVREDILVVEARQAASGPAAASSPSAS
ncbi:MAG: methyltransferase domain-containing protein [Planctomycetota bacterium]|nr:methyltransferase domain-containing protein [Planctomycetota bacterium]